jgi:uncharacterized membrane protein YebE (DUF533 family)
MPQVYKQMIVEGIRGLPPEMLAEVANYVYFLRRLAVEPDAFAAEQYVFLLDRQLDHLDAADLAHLEAEIDGYTERYPHG